MSMSFCDQLILYTIFLALSVARRTQAMGLTVVNVGGLDIIDGNRKMTLAIMWQLMRRHTLNLLQVGLVCGSCLVSVMFAAASS